MSTVQLLTNEQTIASITGVTLTNIRIIYYFRVRFFDTLLTGRIHAIGVAPLQHVSSIETTRRRYPLLLALALLSAFNALLLLLDEGGKRTGLQGDTVQTYGLICGGIALVLLVLWLVVTTNTLTISVSGQRFVRVAASLSSGEVRTFLSQYTALKAWEFNANPQKMKLPD